MTLTKCACGVNKVGVSASYPHFAGDFTENAIALFCCLCLYTTLGSGVFAFLALPLHLAEKLLQSRNILR